MMKIVGSFKKECWLVSNEQSAISNSYSVINENFGGQLTNNQPLPANKHGKKNKNGYVSAFISLIAS